MFISLYAGLMLMASCGGENTTVIDTPQPPEQKPEEPQRVEILVNNPSDEGGFTTYFTPTGMRVGDPMPFFDPVAKDFKVMYLYETDRNDAYCYHPFWGVSTLDGANYISMGEVIPTGRSRNDLDAALGTGCAVYDEAEGKYYIYYTGHADREVVMRATSSDFKTWTKDTGWVLKGEDYGYSVRDFRDPQVFKDDDGLWHMIISSEGKFAEFTSHNLKDWEHKDRFSYMYFSHMLECPDVFKMGDWWYIVFSDAYRSATTRNVRYMKARTLQELRDCLDGRPVWPDNKEGVLDSRAFYAGKTASNGTDRYIWGWCPYRQGANIAEKNINVGADSEPAWSGALVCHKIIQHADGTLTLGKVKGIDEKYTKSDVLKCLLSEKATPSADAVTLNGAGAYAIYDRLGNHNHISMTVAASSASDEFGVSFMRGTRGQDYYSLVVGREGNASRVNFVVEGAAGRTVVKGIESHLFETPADNKYNIDIYTDNSVVTMYINDICAYTQRIYGIQTNCWSVNSYSGNISVSGIRVSQY